MTEQRGKQLVIIPATQTDESQALAEAAKTLTALETEDDADFNAEVFEREFAKAQAKSGNQNS